MQIVGALDVHRRQITFKTIELATGEVRRGRITPAVRQSVREWLAGFAAGAIRPRLSSPVSRSSAL